MKENTIPFWAQPTSKLEFHSTEAQKIKEEKIEESLGLGKKSYGTETDTETWSWFRLPIPKPGFGRTLQLVVVSNVRLKSIWTHIAPLPPKKREKYSDVNKTDL